MFSSSHSFLIRYSAVGLAVTLGLLITASIELLRERAPFLLFFAAVILITRLYGRGPGIATLILAVAITDFFLIPPIYSFVPNVDDAFRIGTFTLLGILTIWIVSSLMQREKEARDNEARYRMLFDYSPDGIVVTDTKANSIDANENICRMLGYTRDELVGKNVSEMIVVAEIPHIDEALELLEAGSEHVREWVFRRKDGSTFLSESRATQMPDGNLMGVIRDISDRKLALVAADELAAIVTSSHDAIIGKDLDGIVTSWNAGAERIYGYSADEMIGQPITRLIPPDRLSEEDDIDANIRQGEATGHFETKRLRNDGNLIDVSITASPIKDAAGNVVGASKVARDITERNLSEEALQASERRLRTIIETEPECVKVISSKGRLMEMNPAWPSDARGCHLGRGPGKAFVRIYPT
ncbi:MAG: PAS domain S-box protein [Pyrinomonadaceae bacterium]